MVRRDGAAIRKERIQEITRLVISLLHKSGGEIQLSKTLGVLAYETGLTREKRLEYLNIAVDTEHFIIDYENDKIKSITES